MKQCKNPLPRPIFDYFAIQNGLARNLNENPDIDIATDKVSISFHAEDFNDFNSSFALPLNILIHEKKWLYEHFEHIEPATIYPNWKYIEELEQIELEKLKADLKFQLHLKEIDGEDLFSRRVVFGGNCLSICQLGLVEAAYVPSMHQTEIWADFFFRSTNVNDMLPVDMLLCCKLVKEFIDIVDYKNIVNLPINVCINLSRAHMFRRTPNLCLDIPIKWWKGRELS